MAELITNVSPAYNNDASIKENFAEYYHWALGLKHPDKTILDVGEKLNYGVQRHPLGFVAIYLSPRSDSGWPSRHCRGIARVNIYPAGIEIRDDIHCHGYDFSAGVAMGGLINTIYKPDFSASLPEGEGYIGYEASVSWGENKITQVTDAVVDVGKGESHELQRGDSYSMKRRVDFHAVSPSEEDGGEGAITIFCKTPAIWGRDGESIFFRKPGAPEPPIIY